MASKDSGEETAGAVGDALVTDYTISHTFDTHKGGTKSSHFVSMRFSTGRPVTVEEAELMAIRSSKAVTRATYYQALARGALSVDEANELLAASRGNHERLEGKLGKKAAPGGDEGAE